MPERRTDKKHLSKIIQDTVSGGGKKQKILSELLEEDEPSLEVKDGASHRIEDEELEYLDEILEPEEKGKLRIPIYFRHTGKEGGGTYEVKGEVEQKVCAEVLDSEQKDYYYRPEIREVRRKLQTTTEYMFSL